MKSTESISSIIIDTVRLFFLVDLSENYSSNAYVINYNKEEFFNYFHHFFNLKNNINMKINEENNIQEDEITYHYYNNNKVNYFNNFIISFNKYYSSLSIYSNIISSYYYNYNNFSNDIVKNFLNISYIIKYFFLTINWLDIIKDNSIVSYLFIIYNYIIIIIYL